MDILRAPESRGCEVQLRPAGPVEVVWGGVDSGGVQGGQVHRCVPDVASVRTYASRHVKVCQPRAAGAIADEEQLSAIWRKARAIVIGRCIHGRPKIHRGLPGKVSREALRDPDAKAAGAAWAVRGEV